MKHIIRLILIYFVLCLLLISCKKDFEQQSVYKSLPEEILGSRSQAMTSTCVEDEDVGSTMDTLLKPTILGYHLVNQPYSLAKMQQAYTNLYGNANGVAITNKYVRFKPSSPQHENGNNQAAGVNTIFAFYNVF